jgi:tetratricopeptide (TPR) repeat protein
MDHKESPQDQINSIIELFSNGQTQEALDAIEALIKDYPNDPVIYNISGVLYKQIGQLDEAIKRFEKALDISPDYAEAHNNLGVTLQDLGLMDEAVISYEKAIASNPEHATAHNNLGNIFKELKQLDEAVKSYGKVIDINPDFPDAHYNLGNSLRELGQFETAIKSYEKVITINPEFSEAHYNLGNSLRELGQLETAIKSYEKAVTINPDYHEAYFNLGSSFQQLGKLDDAIKHYEKAIAIRPNYAAAYYKLSYLKKYTASDPEIAKMQSLLSSDNITQLSRINLCFALAKVNENLDNQDELFKYLHEGNRLHKQESNSNYSFDKKKNFFEIIKEIFNKNPPNIEQSPSFETSTLKPIFIVGMPRSGSTLVEQIMSSHHAVHGAGEFQDFRKILGSIVGNNLTKGSEIASTSIGNKKMNLSNNYSLPETAFLSLRNQYLDVLSNLNVPESVITDKSLLNFRYIGFILTAFPEAKIVHMKRDARAICWSIYSIYLRGFDFGNDFEDLAGFYGLYIDIMDYWHQLFPGQIYDICYEDLTTNQEEETRKLLQYCELDWDKNCLNFHKNKRAVKTASAKQVRKKMYQGSSEAWKKYESHLKPLIKALSSF